MKIAVIGAGSTYTPELMEGLLEEAITMGVTEVALTDTNRDRLNVVGRLAQRMASACGSGVSVTLSESLEQAVAGSNYVVIQIRVGGQEARHADELICQRYGVLGQETTGAGGFSKAMRTIPVVLGILDTIHRSGANPVIVNFTNPSGIVTQALAKHTHLYVVGLCNIPTKMRMRAAEYLGVCPEKVYLEYVGLNHLGWVRGVYCEGRDVTGRVLYALAGERATDGLPPPGYESVFLDALNAVPTSYLKYYYLSTEMKEMTMAREKTRAQEVMEIERDLLRLYADPSLAQKPKQLEKRGGAYYSKAAVSLIKSIELDLKETHIINVTNRGAIADFPYDAVVEVPAIVGRKQATPLAIGKLMPHMLGLMYHVKAYEELTIEAAVKKSYKLALLALSMNPLVPSTIVARKLLDEFVRAHSLELS